MTVGGIIFLFLVDRLLKYWALNYWVNKEFVIIKNILQLELFQNLNIAFSIPLPQNLIIVITILFIGGLTYYLFILNYRKGQVVLKTSLLLIIAGGISNLYDRLQYGFVVDYINIPYFPVFNLCDVMISAGAVLIAVFVFKHR